MRILVVNDDGIEARGIEILAKEAAKFGEVWVAAPDEQCSAMSQCITLRREISVRESPFPVKKSEAGNFLSEKSFTENLSREQSLTGSIRAFRIGGTPADCVKIAISYLMPQKPDYIFSGINFGYNAGYDVAYSGTVGAAMEGMMKGICSAAFSVDTSGIYGTVERYLPGIIKEILESPPLQGKIWNINFPGCEAAQCKGILRGRKPAGAHLFIDTYRETRREADGTVYLTIESSLHDEIGSDNDLDAVKGGYISIGTITGMAFEAGE